MAISNDLLQAKQVLSARFLGASVRARGKGLMVSRTMAAAAQAAGQNVHAVGIGKKVVNGRITDTDCIRLFVTQKIAPSAMAPRDLLPKAESGIPTDVIEAPLAFMSGAAPVGVSGACTDQRQENQTPVIGGISVGHPLVTAGTLGYFCRSTRFGDDPNVVYILSNNHILANLNNAAVGDPVYQPGSLDGGVPANTIASVSRWEPLNLDGVTPNQIDGAIAQMSPSIQYALSICLVGLVQGTGQAVAQMAVKKHGRTSGYTEGTVSDELIDALVGMDPNDPSVLALFQNQMRLVPTSAYPAIGVQGDSGSLVVDSSNQAAVGLYFANPLSGEYAYANHIGDVLTHLEINLL